MNDSMFPSESSERPIHGEPLRADQPPDGDIPQFGAMDIVEAFTAMRHEWRGQTKESRLLAEQIQAAVTNIQSLESKWSAALAAAREGNGEKAPEVKPLVLLITETDHQLSRAISAMEHWETTRQTRAEADQKSIEQYFAGMSPIARWFARPLLTFLTAQHSAAEASAENPAIEGSNLMQARLRRVMKEQEIERLDTQGREFDANTMHAIGTIATTEYPAGYVADQLSPAYLWQGRVLRFADVRVAQ